jgi:hypothetical protein
MEPCSFDLDPPDFCFYDVTNEQCVSSCGEKIANGNLCEAAPSCNEIFDMIKCESRELSCIWMGKGIDQCKSKVIYFFIK